LGADIVEGAANCKAEDIHKQSLMLFVPFKAPQDHEDKN
jgi:hypothetical protein